MERQLTHDAYGHVLTNIGCWSADGEWLVYDTRSDAAGSLFDGRWIERVHVESGRVERLYESRNGAHCGVVTCCPLTSRLLFILGPEYPTADWQYAAYHRRGVMLQPGEESPRGLDAMCYAEPFVPGALRGGSHVHTFDGLGRAVAFTYEDQVLAINGNEPSSAPASLGQRRRSVERNQRSVGLSVPANGIEVPPTHPRNHSGTHFSVLLTRTWDEPEPGSDQIDRAYDDAWIGRRGFSRPSTHGAPARLQPALAFLGDVTTGRGSHITELFLVELPKDVRMPAEDGPLCGTLSIRPRPPLGTVQRRLTYTEDRPIPGVSGPRHWPRSTPDGSLIFFLMRDPDRSAQLWSVSPLGGELKQLMRLPGGVTSAFSVSADGQRIAHVAEGCVCVTSITTGATRHMTGPTTNESTPRPEACVFSPDGRRIAFVRRIRSHGQLVNQVFVVDV